MYNGTSLNPVTLSNMNSKNAFNLTVSNML